MAETIKTELTEMLSIKHPFILAGMNVAAGPALAAAVTNAGGLGVLGGIGYTPKFLRAQIKELKADLVDKDAPFGVDLLLPQVGGSARKTNYDYTKGQLPELLDIIIEEGAKLFVSAVGVPPKWAVEKLHKHGILYMNMIGHVKHVQKCLDLDVDILTAQGGEGGGHTGDIPTSVLIPKVADAIRGKTTSSGRKVMLVAAGGIFDSRGLAASIAMGADAVWVGTRMICATEAGATPHHQAEVLSCNYDETMRTIIYTGRPMHVKKNAHNSNWMENKSQEIRDLTSKGIIPVPNEVEELMKAGKEVSFKQRMEMQPLLMGKCAAAVQEIQPAKQIIEEMVSGAVGILKGATAKISKL